MQTLQTMQTMQNMQSMQNMQNIILLSVFKKCKEDKFTSMLKIKFESDTHFYNHFKCHFR